MQEKLFFVIFFIVEKKIKGHVTHDMWHMTFWHMKQDKISDPEILRFGSKGVLQIWRKRIKQSVNKLTGDKGSPGYPPKFVFLWHIVFQSFYVFFSFNNFSILFCCYISWKNYKQDEGDQGQSPGLRFLLRFWFWECF